MTRLLELLAKQQPVEGSVRAPFFRTVDSISSLCERSRFLQIVARRKHASEETTVSVLRARQHNG